MRAHRTAWPSLFGLVVVLGGGLAILAGGGLGATASSAATRRAAGATVWLCRPGSGSDPCTSSLATTTVSASGARSESDPSPQRSSAFACFYVYPTVSTEASENADLRVQRSEVDAAVAQASRFSRVCQVYAPMYRQVTLAGLLDAPGLAVPATAGTVAYDSIAAGFEAFLAHEDAGRPFVVIGHSQGAAMLILLLQHLVDGDPALRSRLVLAIILGGNVEVPTGKAVGGTFSHIPACTREGEAGCVIAYSSFPTTPPPGSLFGRPGQGVSLQSDQRQTKGLQVLCVNPADPGGPSALLDAEFPSRGSEPTPWVAYPGLYRATCVQASGATFLEVTKATGSSDQRPVVSEADGPDWGYHTDDVNLALGNLVGDVQAAEVAYVGSKGTTGGPSGS